MRVMNVLLHPTPNSVMFFDMVVLSGYLILNLLCGWVVLGSERKSAPPPTWIKPFLYIAICWAPSIHIVTAFLYQGLPGRHYWLTAIMAAKFLSSAFASGPALLVLLCMIIRKFTKFDPGKKLFKVLQNLSVFLIATILFYVLKFLQHFIAVFQDIWLL